MDFIHDLTWDDLPETVRERALVCLKDILATAAAAVVARRSYLKKLKPFLKEFAPGRAPIWFTDQSSSAMGAAFANGLLTDSVDWHDGFRPTKGHAGSGVVPALLAIAADHPVSGKELITALVIGYEVACRGGILTHFMYRPVFHASGSWSSIGAAAAAGRICKLPRETLDETLGMAEYHAPLSPMMRCIDVPTNLKDAACAGAMAGIEAVVLKRAGFNGLPSVFAVPQSEHSDLMTSWGREWLIMRQYFKPHPTCRWTHPPVEAIKALQQQFKFSASDIRKITIATHASGARLKVLPPRDSDQAQYSTRWAVAAYLVDGELGMQQINEKRLSDSKILKLASKIEIKVDPKLERRFPAENLARVVLTLENGKELKSKIFGATGDPQNPLPPEFLEEKYRRNITEAIGSERFRKFDRIVNRLPEGTSTSLLAALRA